MAFRRWHLALAVAPLALAIAVQLVLREPEPQLDLAGAFAAESNSETVEAPRAAVAFEREPLPVAQEPEAPQVEPPLSPEERGSEVALDHVFGEVTDSYGVPLEGARVSLRAWRGALGAELEAVQADFKGRYRIDVSNWPSELAIRRVLRRREQEPGLTPLELASLGPVQLRLSADLPGYGTVTEERTVAEVLEQPLRIDFRLPVGRAVNGRVVRKVATTSRGAPFAEVLLVDSLGNVAGQALTDGKGAYTLYVPDGTYDLYARLRGEGTALIPEVAIDRSNMNALPTLQLAGTNRMRGRVTYPDGSPVRGLFIEAEHESIAPRTFDGLKVSERIELERSEGLAQSVAQTDPNGEFEFQALRGGEFLLRVPDCDAELLTGNTLQSSSSLAADFVFRGRRLRVEVIDSNAGAVRDAQLECWRVESRFEPSSERELVAHAGRFGVFYLHVDAGERLFVRASGEGSTYGWEVLDVSSLAYEETVRVVLEEELRPIEYPATNSASELRFRLTLEVCGEDGAPILNWIASATTHGHQVPAGWRFARPARDGSLPPLPPGKFRITLAPAELSSFHCFDAVDASVEAEIGGAQTLKLKVPSGGRLRFRAPPDSTGKDNARGFTRAQDLELRGWKAEVIPSGGSRQALPLHLVSTDPTQGAGNRVLPEVEVETYPTLLPGLYELRLSRPGSEPRSVKVTVRAGKVTTVEP